MYKQHIDTVVEYLESEEVIVDFHKGALCAFWKSNNSPLITIDTNLRLNKRLYVLLHEAGHYVVHTNKEKLERLQEEHKAWEYGLQLAKNLDISIDEDKFWSYANYNLNAYQKEYQNVTS